MAQLARISYDTCLFHITCRGNNKQTVFKDEPDYKKFLRILKKYKEKFLFKLYSYVLMKNHPHLVIETTNKHSISKIMHSINLSYSHYFRKKYKYVGHVWQGRFKSKPIGKDSYLLSCLGYIDLNPVRKKLVVDPADYKWGSYRCYAFGEKNELIDIHRIYESLGATDKIRQREYINFVLGDTSQDRP